MGPGKVCFSESSPFLMKVLLEESHGPGEGLFLENSPSSRKVLLEESRGSGEGLFLESSASSRKVLLEKNRGSGEGLFGESSPSSAARKVLLEESHGSGEGLFVGELPILRCEASFVGGESRVRGRFVCRRAPHPPLRGKFCWRRVMGPGKVCLSESSPSSAAGKVLLEESHGSGEGLFVGELLILRCGESFVGESWVRGRFVCRIAHSPWGRFVWRRAPHPPLRGKFCWRRVMGPGKVCLSESSPSSAARKVLLEESRGSAEGLFVR